MVSQILIINIFLLMNRLWGVQESPPPHTHTHKSVCVCVYFVDQEMCMVVSCDVSAFSKDCLVTINHDCHFIKGHNQYLQL